MWQDDLGLIQGWARTLGGDTVAAIVAAADMLEQQGPTLGRPLVDTITGSKLQNVRELRPASPGSSEIRILFAFDPERMAILLVGGDKASGKGKRDKWSGWYRKAIPEAERLYTDHLRELEDDENADG